MTSIRDILLGISIGFLATLISLNQHAQSEINKNKNITLNQYWNGK
jgi:hypothetical protein